MLPFRELVEHYREKARALLAFVGPAPPHEVYLLAPCELANAILKSAKKAAGPEMEVRIPAAVSGDQLLAVIIHRKVSPHYPCTHLVSRFGCQTLLSVLPDPHPFSSCGTST
jgi:hypothetical protein